MPKIYASLLVLLFIGAPSYAQIKPAPAKPNKPQLTCSDVGKALLSFYRTNREILLDIPQMYGQNAVLFEGIHSALQNSTDASRQVLLTKIQGFKQSAEMAARNGKKNLDELIGLGDPIVVFAYNCLTKGNLP